MKGARARLKLWGLTQRSPWRTISRCRFNRPRAIDDHSCRLEPASDPFDLWRVVSMLDVDVESQPELAQHLRKPSHRSVDAGRP